MYVSLWFDFKEGHAWSEAKHVYMYVISSYLPLWIFKKSNTQLLEINKLNYPPNLNLQVLDSKFGLVHLKFATEENKYLLMINLTVTWFEYFIFKLHFFPFF